MTGQDPNRMRIERTSTANSRTEFRSANGSVIKTEALTTREVVETQETRSEGSARLTLIGRIVAKVLGFVKSIFMIISIWVAIHV